MTRQVWRRAASVVVLALLAFALPGNKPPSLAQPDEPTIVISMEIEVQPDAPSAPPPGVDPIGAAIARALSNVSPVPVGVPDPVAGLNFTPVDTNDYVSGATDAGQSSGISFYQDQADTISQDVQDAGVTAARDFGNVPFYDDHPAHDILPQESDPPAPLPPSLGGFDGGNADAEQNEASDPIHPGTGEFRLERTDLTLPGVGLAFHLHRTYRSRWNYDGPLGFGWTYSYDQRLVISATPCGDTIVHWLTGQGAVIRFLKLWDGRWDMEPETNYRLRETPDGDYIITAPDGIRSTFRPFDDMHAVLTEMRDLNNNVMQFTWGTSSRGSGTPRLEQVVDTNQTLIVAQYGNDGYLDGFDVPSVGVSLVYEVNDDGQLSFAQNAGGLTETYEYDLGHPTEVTYLPTKGLREQCQAHCDGSLQCEDAQPCVQIAADIRSECNTQCFDEGGCQASCSSSCNQSCASLDITSCIGECTPACNHYCDVGTINQCTAAGSEFLGQCRINCFTECADSCADFCANAEDPFLCEWQCQNDCTPACTQECYFAFQNGVGGCVATVGGQCRQDCPAACNGSCQAACGTSCNDACLGQCSDPSTCNGICNQALDEFSSTCNETCVDSCVSANAHPSGLLTFGVPNDLNHNLLRIFDGNGVLYVENVYEDDLHSPAFDHVIRHTFGDAVTLYRYYDLKTSGAPTIAPEDVLLVDATPESAVLCTTTCDQIIPGTRGREVWIPILPGEYLVIPEPIPPDPPPLEGIDGGWPVDVPIELDIYRWYELEILGPEKGLLQPPVYFEDGLAFETPHGELIIEPLDQTQGIVSYSGANENLLDSLFGEHGSRVMTLARTEVGWRAYPGRAAGGAKLSSVDLCAGAFVLYSLPDSPEGEVLGVFPEDACEGTGTFTELGRHPPDNTQRAWESLVTNPYEDLEWTFGPGLAKLSGMFGPDYLPDSLVEPTCTPLEIMTPDPLCEEVSFIQDEVGFPVPNCGEPWFHRGSTDNITGYTPWPDAVGPSLGCGVYIPPGLPPICINERYAAAGTVPYPSHFQPIAQATMVADPTGTAWTYYADEGGTIQRIINNGSGARIDRNFDDHGRLVGERSAYGDRVCIQYDDDWNPTRVTALPAPNTWAPVPELHYLRGFGEYGRVTAIGDPNPGPLRPLVEIFHDRSNWNVDKVVYPEPGHEVTYERDSKGRVERVIHPTGHSTRITYDSAIGLWETMIFNEGEPDQRIRSTDRNALGQVLQLREEGQPNIDWTWSPDGRLLSESIQVDPVAGSAWLTTTYQYDAAGDLETIFAPERTIHLTYNPQGLLESVREEAPEGSPSTCFAYDGRGELIETIDAEGRRTRLHRDVNGDVVQIDRGVWTSGGDWEAECAGNLTDNIPDQIEVFETMTRDAAGQVTFREIGPDSASGDRLPETFHYTYDGYGRLAEIQLSNGVRYRLGHDARHQVVWSASYWSGADPLPVDVVDTHPDPNDPTLVSYAKRDYDYLGRLLSQSDLWFVDDPSQGRQFLTPSQWLETSHAYRDDLGQMEITDAQGNTTIVDTDFYGRVTHVAFPDGQTTLTNDYADSGRTVTQTVAPSVADGGQWVEVYRYKSHGGLAQVEDATGELLQEITYDDFGRPIRVADRGSVRVMGYDSFGALMEIGREYGDGTVEPYQIFHYNRNGTATGMEDGLGQLTWRALDHVNRPSEEHFPDGTLRTLGYFTGTYQVRQRIDRNGEIFGYGYDNFGQPSFIGASNNHSSAGWAQGSRLEFSWNVLGLESATANNGTGTGDDVTLTFIRDSLGQVTEEHSNLYPNESISYMRDPLLRVTQLNVGSLSIERPHDPLGRLREVTLAGTSDPWVEYRYQGHGLPHEIHYQNGLVEDFGYDEEARPLSANVTGAGTQFNHNYLWSTDGNLARIDQQLAPGGPTISSVYRADELGRLTSAGHGLSDLIPMTSGSVTPVEIDAHLALSPQQEHYTYDPVENWNEAEVDGVTVQPTPGLDHRYIIFGGPVDNDSEGNVLGLSDGTQYGYDGLGRMVWARLPDGTVRNFFYDGLGHLVGWDGDESVRLQYANDTLIREDKADSAPVYHIPGAGLGPALILRGTDTYFNHFTFGERVAIVTDVSGTIVERVDYSSYGAPTVLDSAGTSPIAGSTIGNRLFIAGQPYLSSFGLYSFGVRLYRPEMGRFLSQDPLGFIDGPNPYTYGRANPLMYIDPGGYTSSRVDSGRRLPLEGVDDLFTRTGMTTAGRSDIPDPVPSSPPIHPTLGVFGLRIPAPGHPLPPREVYTDAEARRWAAQGDYIQYAEIIEQGLHCLGCHIQHPLGRVPRDNEWSLAAVDRATREHAIRSMEVLLTGVTVGAVGLFGSTARGGALVLGSEEVLGQAAIRGPEIVSGFRIFGNKGLVGTSFQRNVLLIEATNKGAVPLRSLATSLEAEALASGATELRIVGHAVVNQGFLKPAIARRFGYQLRNINNQTIELLKVFGP